jgi:transposase
MPATYIGVDVSKDSLDVAVDGSRNLMHVTNDDAGVQKVVRLAIKRQAAVVCFEATGGYEVRLWIALSAASIPAAMVNPRLIRHFAQGLGRLAKTDAIDAHVIAEYARSGHPRTTPFPTQTAELKDIASRRGQLVQMLTAERNRLHIARSPDIRTAIQAHIDWLQKELAQVDKDLRSAIRESPESRQRDEILRSVPGVGNGLSASIIARLPEIGALNRRKQAALVGVAPLNRDSGHYHGKRTVWAGRSAIRAALYMSALSATRCNPVIRPFYQRLLASGKAKKTALTACMRKLLTILNAMIRTSTPWNPNYVLYPIDN